MPAINEKVEWLTMAINGPLPGPICILVFMHASVNVFWSRGYQQEGYAAGFILVTIYITLFKLR